MVPLIPLVDTFFPLLTALPPLFTVPKTVLALLIVPFLPPNLLAFTADILAFTAFEYFDTFLLAMDLTPVSNCGLCITWVAPLIRSSMYWSKAIRSAAPRSAAASNRACPGGVARAPKPNVAPKPAGERLAAVTAVDTAARPAKADN